MKRMDDLIRRKATGCACDFASKLGVSQSQLYEDIKEMKELGAPIVYCTTRKSYIYNGEAKLIFTFKTGGLDGMKGGKNIFCDSSISGVEAVRFVVQCF